MFGLLHARSVEVLTAACVFTSVDCVSAQFFTTPLDPGSKVESRRGLRLFDRCRYVPCAPFTTLELLKLGLHNTTAV